MSVAENRGYVERFRSDTVVQAVTFSICLHFSICVPSFFFFFFIFVSFFFVTFQFFRFFFFSVFENGGLTGQGGG